MPQPPARDQAQTTSMRLLEEQVSKEIVEAVQNLEREKGISSEKLMLALEDALLSAYKKTPGAASTPGSTWIAAPPTSACSS